MNQATVTTPRADLMSVETAEAVHEAMMTIHAALHDADENVARVFSDTFELADDEVVLSAQGFIDALRRKLPG